MEENEKIYLSFLVTKNLADLLTKTARKRYQSRSKLIVQLLSESLNFKDDADGTK